MRCKRCQGECQKVNKFVFNCCRCSGITYKLQCSACHEKIKLEAERKAAGVAAVSDSPVKDSGKTLAVKGGTQATTYGIEKAFSKSSERALQRELEIASGKATEKALTRAAEGAVAQSEFVHISGAIARKTATDVSGRATETVLVKASEKAVEKAVSQAALDSTVVAAEQGAKLGAQVAGKTLGTGAKLIEGAGTPWQLGSVAAEFGVEAIAAAAGANKTVQKVTGKVAGATTSVAIGAAVAGPVGAVGGAIIWGVGEGISQAVDAIVDANTRTPLAPCEPVDATPMCDRCHISMALPAYAKDGLNLCANCST